MRSRRRATVREPGRSSRRRLLGWIVLAAAGLLLYLYVGRFLTIRELRNELAVLSDQEQVARSLQEGLEERLAKAGDPETIERLSRELLGLVKPGEEKVIFLEEN